MFLKIVKHPITNFLIATIGIIIAVVTPYLQEKEIEPRYAVSEPETLAEATADAPGLKLLWEGEEIENIHSISIAIWNAGRQFLDKKSISATDPIRIVYPTGTDILYARFTRTSRNNLKFTATDLASRGVRAIQIDVVGDEALERNDGGLLRVLYSGVSTKEFFVTGRIKGSREGFTRVDWKEASGESIRVPNLLMDMFAVAGMIMIWVRNGPDFAEKVTEYRNNPKGKWWMIPILLLYAIMLLLFGGIGGTMMIIGIFKRFLIILPWLS